MKMPLNDASKKYMNSRVAEFESGTLSLEDEKQLFQDLLDSGYISNFPNYQGFVNRLSNVGLVKTSGLNKLALN